MVRAAWQCIWCASLALFAAPLAAQQRPLDNGSEELFDAIDTRLFVDALPPRLEGSAATPPALGDLLPQAPLFTEGRDVLLTLDFNGYNLDANPQRLLFLQPDSLDLVPDGTGGQALRIRNAEAALAGFERALDPNRLAGRVVELTARVLLDGPYQRAANAEPWDRPVIQVRWERPHPDRARRLQGETLRVWRTIFEVRGAEQPPATFLPDRRFHTYRCRLTVPDDLLGATLQAVMQRCAGTMVVDSLSLSLVETREDRQVAADLQNKDGNLIGPAGSFELGLTRGAVTGERRLSPLAGGPVGRDFGDWRIVADSVPDGRQCLAVLAKAGRGAAVEFPWVGLAAGQTYTLSAWLRAGREGVKAAFGVGDADWRLLGSPVVLDTRWRRYAATVTAPRARAQAFWPWISLDAAEGDTQVQIDGVQLEAGAEATPLKRTPTVELAIGPDPEPGPGLRNLGDPDQPLQLTARLLQRGGGDRQVRLRGVLESHSGRLYRALAQVPTEVTLPSDTVVEVPLWDGPLPRGYYRFWLVATDAVSGEVRKAERLFAVLGRPRTTRFGFLDGPGPPARTAAVAEAAQRVGGGLLSLAGTPAADWREHWTGDATFDWSLLGPAVEQWAATGLELVHTIGPRVDAWPSWILDRYGPQFRVPRGGIDRVLPPDKLFGGYVTELARRHAGRIKAYELFDGADESLQADEYLALLRLAREAIRAVDPTARVIGPGLRQPASVAPGGFLEQLLAQGGGELLDVVTCRLQADYPEALDAARDHLRRLADRTGVRLWDLGHGYPEAPVLSDRLNPGAGAEPRHLPSSPATYDGAAFTARHELLLAAAGFERSCLAAAAAEVEYLHLPVGPLNESDGSPRSSLAALAVLSEELGDARPLGEWRWDLTLPGPAADYDHRLPQGVRAVAFATGDDRCLLAWWTWQRDAALTVTFAPAAAARLFVVTGEAVQAPADGRVSLTHAPLFLADLPRSALRSLSDLVLSGRRPEAVPPPARPAGGDRPA